MYVSWLPSVKKIKSHLLSQRVDSSTHSLSHAGAALAYPLSVGYGPQGPRCSWHSQNVSVAHCTDNIMLMDLVSRKEIPRDPGKTYMGRTVGGKLHKSSGTCHIVEVYRNLVVRRMLVHLS